MNRINIILTLTRDPEIRYTPAGTAVCSFSGAYNETYGKGEDKKTVVSYFDCIAWSGLAELVNTHFKKGHKIGIDGKLKQERWDDQDGKSRSAVKIVAENIDFLQGKRDKDGEYKEPEKTETPDKPQSNEGIDNPFDDDAIPW